MDVAAATALPMTHAFITWDATLGRRMCPLATFGSRAPFVASARLVCVDPPRADREALTNADDVRGAIALVVRGGCSFMDKARRIQDAGAIAMILANNTREEPFAMFAMAADGPPTADPTDANGTITIPCVMMCLHDVRKLFKQYPPSVKTGILTMEIYAGPKEHELVAECEAKRLIAMQQPQKDCGSKHASGQDESVSSGGWGAVLKRKTNSLIKLWESPAELAESPREVSPTTEQLSDVIIEETAEPPPAASVVVSRPSIHPKSKLPLFAFVQWATSASDYVLFFAPLADFCLVANNAIYEGRRVACDPLLANEDPIRNAAQLVDAIALVQRGACTFPSKLERIQRGGAAAAIVGNDDADDHDLAFVMSVDHIKVDHVTIPAVMVSRRVFQRLLEDDRPDQLRILCLSGEAAAQCIARAGQLIQLTDIPAPSALECNGSEFTAESDLDAAAQLHAACRTGDHGACQRVLEDMCADESAQRELVMARDKFQLTALHHACAADHAHAGLEHIVALLLRFGAQPNARDMALHTPLHLACLRGQAACVKRLLTASLNSQELTTARNLGGATPIHYAAMAGSTACLELVLSVNARRVGGERYCFDGVDERDVDGAAPLHVACAATHVDCVMYLVAANADLRVQDKRGRTPLQIACELVNEPSRSLQALHIVEKLMDAGAPVVLGDITVAIDLVESKAIKRELEIAFLRREALQSRGQFQRLTDQLNTQGELIQKLLVAVDSIHERHTTADRVAAEKELRLSRQQRQIDQLQLQIKTLLQVLHRQDGGDGRVENAGGLALLTGLSPHSPAPNLDSDSDSVEARDAESTRAQDAALARDLGRKCCRERQFALAQTYFERSLDVFPLPGVARLLEETKALRRDAEERGGKTGNRQSDSTALGQEGDDDGARLRRCLGDIAASQRTKEALASEITKLESLCQGSSDYSTMLKWIEWLLALPWSNGSCRSLSLEASVFDEIERMDREKRAREQHAAARRIQTTFRERYAVHLMRRAMAGVRIQRAYQTYKAHQERQRQAALAIMRNRQRTAAEGSVATATVAEDDGDEELVGGPPLSYDFDVTTTADPRAVQQSKWKQVRVARGESMKGDAYHCTLQLLVVDPGADRSRADITLGNTTPSHFVWRRWGETRDESNERVLCGPYEALETATARYERMRRDYSPRAEIGAIVREKQESHTSEQSSAWTWMRASAS